MTGDVRSTPDFTHLGIVGLDAADVDERIRAGQVNVTRSRTSRSYADIVRANVFTWFNLILGALWVLMVTYGSIRDALFGFVLLFNTAIGIAQEVRAKVVLDRLTLVTAPRARVVRGGRDVEVDIAAVVLDDIVLAESGDQIVVDGEVVWSDSLEVDEALLTGESTPERKSVDDPVMAGSFAVAGRGAYRARAVGPDTRAERMVARGRKYVRVQSEVMGGINSILKTIGILIVPTGALMTVAALRADARDVGVTDIVAALVGMVPEGLVLLSSIAFALSAIVLARHRVLANELGAVEVLARTDVVCADKTGTLTEPQPAFSRFEPIGSTDPGVAAADALAALSALALLGGQGNTTAAALSAALPPPVGWTASSAVPFSSARKWSAARFEGRGTWVLGAPEVLMGAIPDTAVSLRTRAAELAGAGPRVLMLAMTDKELPADALPDGMRPMGFAVLAEALRPDAAGTVAFLGREGVAIKILSGDAVETVAAIARRAAVPGAERAVDARMLPGDEALADVMEQTTVFGRVQPEQKSGMIEALQMRGHTVAMVGDGVNDVLAVKSADLGIAMGSGAAATRAVAQLVLLDGRFAEVPLIMSEGRRVMANAERVANLFITKTAWATLLALLFGVLASPYPFLPRQITLAGSLTIGIPAFFLALAPNARLHRPGFVRRVLKFALPVGALLAATIVGTYAATRAMGASMPDTRTACTLVLVALGLCVIATLERPVRGWRLGLLALMAAGMAIAMTVPFAREFFALTVPAPEVFGVALGIAVPGCILVRWYGARLGMTSREVTDDGPRVA